MEVLWRCTRMHVESCANLVFYKTWRRVMFLTLTTVHHFLATFLSSGQPKDLLCSMRYSCCTIVVKVASVIGVTSS